ncbi:hypothetical protein SAMN05216377_12312 [Pseudonocardia oroxyli]|uniref:Uncharacterized protein n=1 Tax=Pseudonocardia oroxyli TaxID=366584 RepID=A0A1G8CNH1_PSEOR|nr:hypothetical protein SAMN05216377_12312 [Pseudonocardia oroxyli]
MGRPTIRPTFGSDAGDRVDRSLLTAAPYSALSSGSTFSLKRRMLASAFSMGIPA